MMRSFRDGDVLTGLMFIALAVLGFLLSSELEAGSAGAMGPGYFPRLVSGILLGLGVLIAAVGLWSGANNPIGNWTVRPLALISLAALLFAALLHRGGLVLAIAICVLIGSFAGGWPRLMQVAALIVVLALASVSLFVWGLGIPLPVWPNWRS